MTANPKPCRLLVRAPVMVPAFALVTALAMAPAPDPAQAHGVPENFSELAGKLSPAVVNISTSQAVRSRGSAPPPGFPRGTPFDDFFEEFFNQRRGAPARPRNVRSLGSGFIIDSSGLIVTNNHVIESADKITVILSGGEELEASIMGRDPRTDIALLKVEPEKPLQPVRFVRRANPKVGDWVLAIGNPFGLGGTVTAGIVSAIHRDIGAGPYDDFIQTDAAINRGSSGGPLFNIKGEVIGVNTVIISPSGGSVGVGFAIPADAARRVIEQLRTYGETRRGWLGVVIQGVTEEIAESLELGKPRGALVSEVTPDGPADKAGIMSGDVILAINGDPVETMRELPRMVARKGIGENVAVRIFRDGRNLTRRVELGRLEDAPIGQQGSRTPQDPPPKNGVSPSGLGMSLTSLSPNWRRRFNIPPEVRGVLITEVERGSTAADKRLRPGDVILEAGRKKVATPRDITAVIRDSQKQEGRRSILFQVWSRGAVRFVALAPATGGAGAS